MVFGIPALIVLYDKISDPSEEFDMWSRYKDMVNHVTISYIGILMFLVVVLGSIYILIMVIIYPFVGCINQNNSLCLVTLIEIIILFTIIAPAFLYALYKHTEDVCDKKLPV